MVSNATAPVPLLQVALDYFSLPPAIAMAVKVAPYVDVIEIGTPLCKAAGIEAVRAIREVCPDNLILADLKTPDVGDLEAKMAFDAGADFMTVIGGAALATVELAVKTAREMGKEMLTQLDTAIIGGKTLWAYFCRKLARAERAGDPRFATEPVPIGG